MLPQKFEGAAEIAPTFVDLGVGLPRVVWGKFEGVCGNDGPVAETRPTGIVCETRLEELRESPPGLRGIVAEKLRPRGYDK